MKGHGIMISVPLQGHINPFVNLALNLASKGITITFVHLEHIHHKLSKAHHHANESGPFDLFSDARESGLDIRYTTISDGLPRRFDRDLNAEEYWESLQLREFPSLVDEFVGKMILSHPFMAPNILITDSIYTWPANIAKKYNLVNVSFWTQPALVFSLSYHVDLLKEKGHFPCQDNQLEIDYIPGVQSITGKDLSSALKQVETTVNNFFFTAIEEAKKADFILLNTVYELEPESLTALNKYQPNYAVGPINVSRLNGINVSESLRVKLDCTQWLESRSPGSVLYVSFGSVVQTSKQVIEEIAYGLFLSEVNFIWVVRAGVTGSEDGWLLPDGFEDEIKGRGLIIPWCDQIRVLSNPAVGGFLTHCGWNSVVESIWCGIPMICYPVMFDQPTNRKLVVDDWKIGINLCDGKLLDRKEVAEKIKSFMNEASSERLRQEVKIVKHTLHNALEIDGSSTRNFDQFMKDLEKKLPF